MGSNNQVTKITVGSVIAAIVLLSFFGVNRAFRFLAGGGQEDPERIESARVDSFTSSDEADSRSSQNNTSQIASERTVNEDGESVLAPLQVAGTFIQRQKRIEEDPTVLRSDVTVLAVADSVAADNPPAAQSNTITTDQSAPSATSNTSTRPANPASSTAPAVPALW